MSDKDNIHVITTGGTIDSQFDPVQYKPTPRPVSGIESFIQTYIKPYISISYSQVSAVDSLDMTDDIRLKIAQEIDNILSERILITHGTDTITETAEYLLNYYKKKPKKTIILTGAMFPLTFYPSDAAFNLGYALAKLEFLPHNLYVCMNTHIFAAGTVKKNKQQGIFEDS